MSNEKNLLNTALSALNQGDISKTRQFIYKIKNYANNPEALYLLALCHAVKNEFIEAEKLFTKTLNKSSPTESLFTNLGLSQLHQKKIHDAINSFLAAININSGYYDALANLATCYDYINMHNSAIKYAQQANKLKHDNPVIINIIAKYAQFNNKHNEAIALYNKSLALQPGQIQIYTQLSNTFFLKKDYNSSELIIKKGLTIFPDNPFLTNSLGNFFSSRNKHNEAINEFNNVLEKNKNNTTSIAAKARSLIALQEFDKAQKILINAYKNYPDNHEIITELSHYYILNKDYESAYNITTSFINNLEDNTFIPGNILLFYCTACLHSDRLEQANELLELTISKNIYPPEVMESLNFIYGDILDGLNVYDNAFKCYQYANEIIPRASDINYYETILSELSNTVDRAFLDKVGSSDNNTLLPVFIVGMPRSGTSLIEQILSSHPNVYGAGELTDLWMIGNTISGAMNMLEYTKNFSALSHEKLIEFSNLYLSAIKKLANAKSRVTDKLPHNFMHIGLIECLFPKARIIHCQRHPFDTCLSIYFKKFNDNHVYARDLEELALFYKKYMALMDHWYKNSSLSILTIKYEDMVNQQIVESKKIIKHIGLDWSDRVLNYYNSDRIIMTPSYHQASKPIYTSSINRWKNYNKHLKPLIKILGDPEQYI